MSDDTSCSAQPWRKYREYPRAADAGARGLFNAVSSKSCLPKCLPGPSLLGGALRGSCGPGCRLGLRQAEGRAALCSQEEGVWNEYLGFNPQLGGQKQPGFGAKGLHTALASTLWSLRRGRDMGLSVPEAPLPVAALLRPLQSVLPAWQAGTSEAASQG